MRIPVILLVLIVVLFSSTPSANADPSASAKVIDEQARAYFKVGAFEDAAKEFIRANAVEQNSGRLYNAGFAYESAGMLEKAVELYSKFLAVRNTGSKAAEAKARKLDLEKRIVLAAKKQQTDSDERALNDKIKSHTTAASAHLSSGDYKRAAQEFAAAYDLKEDAELLFYKAEAQRLAGLKTEALASYQQYKREAPRGPNLAKAEERRTEIENSLLNSKPGEVLDIKEATSNREREISWPWISAGFGALAVGLAVDLIPGSASNGEIDVVDFAPVALYAVGAGFIYTGVFQYN